jgi:hypothetical protein
VEERLPDELIGKYQGDIQTCIGQLAVVDLADVNACDLLDHVTYSCRVANRFYGPSVNPESMPSIRIRTEVSSNSGWMRELYPVTHQLTAKAETPDAAAKIICKWARSQVRHIEPTTFPFGEKFGQDAMTTLRGHRGDRVDVAVLTVAALRSAGVAAHIVPVYPDRFAHGTYTLVEYYDGTEWKPCYPSMDSPAEPKADPKALAALNRWLADGKRKNAAVYALQGGVWRPYNSGGRDLHAEASFDLLPGTYLATYTTGDICHTKTFVVGRAR